MSLDSYYLATLQRCRARGLQNIQRYRGRVDKGYGRGGKKLGVPTANLPSSLFQNALENVNTGVYFGWATLENINAVYKAVVNVGFSPTFEGQENKEKIIEAHLILADGEKLDDFYGEHMRLQLVGYLRVERKFDSFTELVTQINADVKDADSMLDMMPYNLLTDGEFLEASLGWIGSGGGNEEASWEFFPMSDELAITSTEEL